MGSGANYRAGDTTEYWETTGMIDGIKVLRNSRNVRTNDLPTYAKSSNEYFKRVGENGTGDVIQLRLYKLNPSTGLKESHIDIDLWASKEHGNPDGTFIPADVAHYHTWHHRTQGKKKGELARGRKASLLTDDMIKKWGATLRKAYPNIKFR